MPRVLSQERRRDVGGQGAAAAVMVAILGCVASAGPERRERFLKLSEHHDREALFREVEVALLGAPDRLDRGRLDARAEHHRRLAEKYRRASDWPWLPMLPDLPAP